MKKKRTCHFLSALLVILLMIHCLPMTIIAEELNAHTVFSIGNASGMCGDTVELNISVSGDMAVSGLLLYGLSYDTSALEFVGFKSFGELVTGSVAGSDSISANTINLGYNPNIVPIGNICTVVFKVKETAAEGNYSVTFSTVASSDNGKAVSCKLMSGIIEVSEWLRGDFDENGIIDMQDAVHFIGWVNFSYIPGLYSMPYSGDKDFNHDGEINMQDAVYLIGWINFSYIPGLYDIVWYSGINCKHSFQHTNAKDASCTEDGNIEFWYCTDCGKYFSDANGKTEISIEDTVIKAHGHSMKYISAQAATYDAHGHTEYYHCTACDKLFADQFGNREITIKDTETPILVPGIRNITYVGLKGAENPNPAQLSENKDLELKDLVLEGYDFDGWYDKDEKKIQGSYISKGQGDITVYAHWKVKKYNISYNCDYGDIKITAPAGNPTSYDIENGTGFLKSPELRDYDFVGWFDENDNKIEKVDVGTTGDMKLTGRWSSQINKAQINQKLDMSKPDQITSVNGQTVFLYYLGKRTKVPLSNLKENIQRYSPNVEISKTVKVSTTNETKEIEQINKMAKGTIDTVNKLAAGIETGMESSLTISAMASVETSANASCGFATAKASASTSLNASVNIYAKEKLEMSAGVTKAVSEIEEDQHSSISTATEFSVETTEIGYRLTNGTQVGDYWYGNTCSVRVYLAVVYDINTDTFFVNTEMIIDGASAPLTLLYSADEFDTINQEELTFDEDALFAYLAEQRKELRTEKAQEYGLTYEDLEGAIIFDDLSTTPQSVEEGHIYIIDMSKYSGTVSYAETVKMSDGSRYGGGNFSHDISNTSEIYFIGNKDATFTDLSIYTVHYPKDSELTIHLVDFNYVGYLSSWFGDAEADDGLKLTLDITGDCSITANPGHSAINTFKDLTITGSGKLSVYGGEGASGTTAGADGSDGLPAICIENLTVDMDDETGGLYVYGGKGGDGADGISYGQKGGDGGNGGYAISALSIDIISCDDTILVGGSGGLGADGFNGTDGGPERVGLAGEAGGQGGNGGNGGDGSAPVDSKSLYSIVNIYGGHCILVSGNGGNGGRGGNGGHGGNAERKHDYLSGWNGSYSWYRGGDGGNGGNGGNAGDTYNIANDVLLFDTTNNASIDLVNGCVGYGGSAGNGGDGGNAGYAQCLTEALGFYGGSGGNTGKKGGGRDNGDTAIPGSCGGLPSKANRYIGDEPTPGAVMGTRTDKTYSVVFEY